MELNEIRARIDAIDEQMLSLFLERMSCAEQVAVYKKERNLPILNAAREQEILAEVETRSGELAPYARELFRVLMDLSKDRQRELFGRMTAAEKEG